MITLQRQPNGWSCLPTSFAMTLDVPVDKIISYMGHDGSEIYFPNRPDPFGRRAFHPQEIMPYALLMHNTAILQFDQTMLFLNKYRDIKEEDFSPTMAGLMCAKCRKVLTGSLDSGSRFHAVALDVDNIVYDPNGTKYTLDTLDDKFNITSLFLIIRKTIKNLF